MDYKDCGGDLSSLCAVTHGAQAGASVFFVFTKETRCQRSAEQRVSEFTKMRRAPSRGRTARQYRGGARHVKMSISGIWAGILNRGRVV